MFVSLVQYYNAWLSLLGMFISVVVMFMIQWEVALATFGVTMALYLLVHYRKPGMLNPLSSLTKCPPVRWICNQVAVPFGIS